MAPSLKAALLCGALLLAASPSIGAAEPRPPADMPASPVAGAASPVAGAASPVEGPASPVDGPAVPAPAAPAEKLAFAEVWSYLMDGEERFFSPARPITDVGYFGAGLSAYGKLVGVPSRDKIKDFKGRVHLVVAEVGNYALTHFALDPAYPIRDELVADIVKAAASFDGVQIDFEAVPAKDYDNFRAFIGLLRAGLGAKALSLALPAVVNDRQDRFGYAALAALSDRVVIMAYDEHWSGSAPGPVASLEWGRKVSAYALSQIPLAKLVMGAPFYGRAWADKNLSRAYKYTGMTSLVEEKQLGSIQRREGIPYVEYVETVSVKAYFEDAASAQARLSMYRGLAIDKVAFWRLGQEDPAVWACLAIAQAAQAPQGAAAGSPAPAAVAPASSGPAPAAPVPGDAQSLLGQGSAGR